MRQVHFQVNTKKTTKVPIENDVREKFILNQKSILKIKEYLERLLLEKFSNWEKIDGSHHSTYTGQAYGTINNTWKSVFIKRETKIRIFNNRVRNVLLY